MKKCGTLFPMNREYSIVDEDGCILDEKECKGNHLFVNKFLKWNVLTEWEYDWECGCEDCRTDNINDMCIVYSEISNNKVTKPHWIKR